MPNNFWQKMSNSLAQSRPGQNSPTNINKPQPPDAR